MILFSVNYLNPKSTHRHYTKENKKNKERKILSYRPSSSPSDELRIVLYAELRLRNIRKKLPTANIVRR